MNCPKCHQDNCPGWEHVRYCTGELVPAVGAAMEQQRPPMDKAKRQEVACCRACGMTLASYRKGEGCPVPLAKDGTLGVPLTSTHRFHALVAELGPLHDRKSRGYGTATDPYANHRRSAEWGTPAWQSPARRIGEKMQRVRGYAKLGAIESQVDLREELMDVAVLALIAVVLWEENTA